MMFESKPFDYYEGGLADKIEGQRVVQLLDDDGSRLGMLAWRLASGHTVEITEMEIHSPENRRSGLGRQLLNQALGDMQEYFDSIDYCGSFRRVWLITEASNDAARAFYQACGFWEETKLGDFYSDGDAVLCVLDVESPSSV